MEIHKAPNNEIISNKINDKGKGEEENNLLKLKFIFTYDLVINHTNKNMTLSELREEISKNYSIKDGEYELFIGNNSINNLSDISDTTKIINVMNRYKITTTILNVMNRYKIKEDIIKIKTFKNHFDVQKQIKDYDKFLAENIMRKSEEIDLLNNEYENIIKDLNNNNKLV